MLFSVVTSTYNRGYIIENLYRSLQRQNFTDFEWIVIDDGSTDQTEKLFSKWIEEDNKFTIKYFKQENIGLIRSLNKAFNKACGEYIIKVDSDDYITDDCLEFFASKIKNISGDVYAVAGIRGKTIDNPIKGSWPLIDENVGYVDATDLERKKYNLDADMCEAWRKDILIKYPLKVWETEKFAPEQISFFQIALDGYKIRWFSKILCICNYRNDGLTLGADKLVKENPMGYAMMYDHMLNYDISIKGKLVAALQCDTLAIVGKNPHYIFKYKHVLYKIIMFPLALFLSIRRKRQFNKLK